MNATLKHRLWSAIALNNITVTLLERNSYHQAHETIQDAAELMEGIEIQPSGVEGAGKTEDITVMLDSANKRLAQPETGITNVPYLFLSQDHFIGAAQPIRIAPDGCESPSSSDLSLASAIIIHNAGLSFFCQACLAQSADPAYELVDAAISLLKTAYESFASQEDFWTTTILVPAINCLSALVKSLFAAGRQGEMEDLTTRLESLKSIADDLSMSRQRNFATCAIGAAAA